MPYPVVQTDPGVTRQVLAENADMMVVAFRFDEGAEGKLHNHPHAQSTYVEKGRFTFWIGADTRILSRGDGVVIPSNVRQGCKCIEAGTLIDTFTPRRDDFL